MSKYICRDCNKMFDEPAVCHDDLTEYWGVWSSGTYTGCPFCESDIIDEIEEDKEDAEF